jgi:transposase
VTLTPEQLEIRKTRVTGNPFDAHEVARFWKHVQITDGCWYWTSACNRPNGYGSFKIQGKMIGAHRFSYTITRGAIPKGLCVCHKCDNPSCVRPDHLFIGTHKDNGRDKAEKGRAPSGTRNAGSKVTEAQAAEIRRLDLTGIPQREIASRYGLIQTTVSRIVRADTWRHVAHELGVSRRDRTARGERQGSSKLTAPRVLEIRALAASGVRYADIASQFRVGIPQVSRIVHRKRWGWL